MYTLISSSSLRKVLAEQVPVLGLSLVIAEFLFKFHSFTLECLAFLVTWYLVDALYQRIGKRSNLDIIPSDIP